MTGPSRKIEPNLASSTDWALFLDVDGTLLHIADHPQDVSVSDGLRDALSSIAPLLDHAVALISGRSIEDLDRLFAPLHLPAAGLHGLERRDAEGSWHILGDEAALDDLRHRLADFAARTPGVLVEDKGRAIALHYRLAPERQAEARELIDTLVESVGERLRMIPGKMVFEVKPRLSDKGRAIEAFMKEVPFAGRMPLFVGDDITDEDGFAMVNALGGHSVRVGPPQATAAQYRLDDVNAVTAWLEALPKDLQPAQGRASR